MLRSTPGTAPREKPGQAGALPWDAGRWRAALAAFAAGQAPLEAARDPTRETRVGVLLPLPCQQLDELLRRPGGPEAGVLRRLGPCQPGQGR